MRASEAFGSLLQIGRPFIETREAAIRLGVSTSRASQLLGELAKAGLARRIRRGLWTMEQDVDPLRLPPYLTAPLPAYVSFWSALALHGIIQQIPRKIFVASLDRTRQLTTTVGSYSIHHMKPEVFGGYQGSEVTGFVATPEKALFDTAYLRAPSGRTSSLPELDLPDSFSQKALKPWIQRISHPRLRTLVSRSLEQALRAAARDSG